MKERRPACAIISWGQALIPRGNEHHKSRRGARGSQIENKRKNQGDKEKM